MSKVIDVEMSQIVLKADQPRLDLYDESIANLAESIKENGLLQPLGVRQIAENKYELLTGERRFRACVAKILIELTSRRLCIQDFATFWQNLPRHAGDKFERAGRRWISRPLSRLTNVKGRFAHSPARHAGRLRM